MSDNENTTTPSNAPTHIAYHLRKPKGSSKGFWSRIGAAWPTKSGQGFNIQLDVIPLDGHITLCIATEKKD
jgi:hypothetical protein